MRFCNQCGRQLQNGEVCLCQQQIVQNRQRTGHRPAPGMGYQNGGGYSQPQKMPQPNNNYQQMAQQNGNYQQTYAQGNNRLVCELKNIINEILPIIKNPVEEIKHIAYSQNTYAGNLMIAINLVVTLVVLIIGLLSLKSKMGVAADYVEIPYAKIVVSVVVMSAIMYYSIAGLIFYISKKFFNAPTVFSEINSIVGGKAILDAVILVISGVFFIISPLLGGILYGVGNVYTLLMFLYCYGETVLLGGSKKVYTILITCAAQSFLLGTLYTIILAEAFSSIAELL